MRGLMCVATFAMLLAATLTAAQEEPAKPTSVSPVVRLAAAKSVFVKNAGGSDIPFEVIRLGFSEWGRFTVTQDAAKADLVAEVTSPDDGKKKKEENGGFQASSGSGRRSEAPAPTSTRSDVLLAVYDGKVRVTLWSATEQPKGVEKGMSREDKLAAAGARLMARFKERLDPTPQP
jgi:hypothetical protein